ncbi:hypothetical protein, partial [uncultured Rubinisphaera sp.]|uniref:hypothetical protein n=1 Tax=uncultured Rubinisphaera sp. TaxID=1678686 RepID=UPI0030D8AE4B
MKQTTMEIKHSGGRFPIRQNKRRVKYNLKRFLNTKARPVSTRILRTPSDTIDKLYLNRTILLIAS